MLDTPIKQTMFINRLILKKNLLSISKILTNKIKF